MACQRSFVDFQPILLVNFFISHVYMYAISITVLTSYFMAIMCLHIRFDVINKLLRYDTFFRMKIIIFFQSKCLFLGLFRNLHVFPHFFCRKRFLSKNALRYPYAENKTDSMSFIKYTGKLFNTLCGIMDKLNNCFSLQVPFTE